MPELLLRLLAFLSFIVPRGSKAADHEATIHHLVSDALTHAPPPYDHGSLLFNPAAINTALHLQVDIHGVGEAIGFQDHQFAPVDFSPVDVPTQKCASACYGGGAMLTALMQAIGHGQRRFDAIIVPLSIAFAPPHSRTYYFIESLSPATTALQLVRALPREARSTACSLAALRDEVIAAFSVKELNPRLSAAIDAVILQAVAMEHHPIHICSISAPALAKGLLQSLARGIAPLFLAAGAKYTMAGLVGSMRTLKDGTQFHDPGYLKRADNGVLGIEDIHNLFVGRHEPLVHISASAMESGIVSDSTRNRTEYRCSTSILADANPSSSIGVAGPELRIPGNLLSRFTAIFHFDSGFDKILSTAKAMMGSMVRDRAAIRAIRVQLAALRTQASTPSWSTTAEGAAADLLQDIANTLDETDQELMQSHLVRSANGIRALAMAHAVINRAQAVTEVDVAAIAHILMIRYQSLGELLAHREESVPNSAARMGRQAALQEHFAGQEVTPGDVHRFYRQMGWEVDRKTVYRDLRGLELDGLVGRQRGRVSIPAAPVQACPIAPSWSGAAQQGAAEAV